MLLRPDRRTTGGRPMAYSGDDYGRRPDPILIVAADISVVEGVAGCFGLRVGGGDLVPGVESVVEGVGEDVDGLGGHIALGEEIHGMAFGIAGTAGYDGGMAGAAGVDDDLARLDVVVGGDWGGLAEDRDGTGVHENPVEVAPEGGIAFISGAGGQEADFVAGDFGAKAFLVIIPLEEVPAGEVKGDIIVTLLLPEIFGAKANDCVSALLEIFRSDIKIHDGNVLVLIVDWIVAVIKNFTAFFLQLYSLQELGK